MTKIKLRMFGNVRPFHGLAVLVAMLAGTVQFAGAATFNPFKPTATADGAVAQGSGLSPVTVPSIILNATSPGPGLASFSISDASDVVEASGAVATFHVTLSKALSTTVSVKFSTLNGTASSGSDYVAKSGTLTFQPGQTSKTITVSIVNDAEPPVEPTEFFYVALSNSNGAQIARSVGKANILETPTPTKPSITVNDAPRSNEDPFPQFSRFTVTLSKSSTSPVTVKYATSNGTAIAGFDYKTTTGTLTFQPGQTSKTVTVAILDPDHDPTGEMFIENYFLNLSSPTNATIARAKGKAEIANTGQSDK